MTEPGEMGGWYFQMWPESQEGHWQATAVQDGCDEGGGCLRGPVRKHIEEAMSDLVLLRRQVRAMLLAKEGVDVDEMIRRVQYFMQTSEDDPGSISHEKACSSLLESIQKYDSASARVGGGK